MSAPEHEIEAYLQRRCAELDVLCLKFIVPSLNGYPDRLLVRDGTVVFVELKRPGGKPRKLQAVRIAELASCGANVEVCDTRESVDGMLAAYWP